MKYIGRPFCVLGVLILVGAAAAAEGATTEAWEAHYQEVVAACATASNFRDPKPGGSPVEFDDQGFTLLDRVLGGTR